MTPTMNWEQLLSTKRFGLEDRHQTHADSRSEFQRDYDRLIFSAPFRRLQNKTQVFPLPGSVFVHNRLTHSLEVSCVGRSLGYNVSQELLKKHPELAQTNVSEISTIVSAACLAHDLGNPPFGHAGEQAISTYFSEGKGSILKSEMDSTEWEDLIHFEGNANAFRLLTHQFEGRRKGGFVITYSTLASIVKYPYVSSLAGKKSKFGFFTSESIDYAKIACELGIIQKQTSPIEFARHPLVYLVEAADDICYQIMDLEDAHKLKIITTEEIKNRLLAFISPDKKERTIQIMGNVTDVNEQISYLRSTVIGVLIDECTTIFIKNEKQILTGNFATTLIKELSPLRKTAYEACEKLAFQKIYRSKEVLDVELAGFRIISTLMELLIEAIQHPEKAYSKLLINRISAQYEINNPTLFGRIQAVLDFISGMTDLYALDFYRKINGNSLPSI